LSFTYFPKIKILNGEIAGARRDSGFCIDSEEIDEIISPGLRFQWDEMDFIHEPRKYMTIILLALIHFAVWHDSF